MSVLRRIIERRMALQDWHTLVWAACALSVIADRSAHAAQTPQPTKERIAELIRREKNEGLTPEEKCELDDCLQVEHLMILVKARARQRAAHE